MDKVVDKVMDKVMDKVVDKDKVMDKDNLKIATGFTDARYWVSLILSVSYIS